MKKCIAIDFGASGGRVIAAEYEAGKIILKDIHQFYNGIYQINGHDCWDYKILFDEVLMGLKKVAKANIYPDSIGVDTWGVDFVLLDKDGNLIGQPVSYRDHRTDKAIEELSYIMPLKELYASTGIQMMQFNTIFQLFALLKEAPEQLAAASRILLVPDYFHYLLSGKMVNEYSQASTSQLIHAQNKNWDENLLSKLKIRKDIFNKIVMPGTILGPLNINDFNEPQFINTKVIIPASHDTASAVVAIPFSDKNTLFISSGTWSIIGAEMDEPICTEEAFNNGYTNEGGAGGKILFMTNIMGMWLIQESIKLFNPPVSYKEIDGLIDIAAPFTSIIDVTDSRFLNPKNMIKEIQNACADSSQLIPKTPVDISMTIYQSIAHAYAKAIKKFEQITGRTITKIAIVGGGSRNYFLNQLTANITGCEVTAGVIEATAAGNVAIQLIALGELKNLDEAREVIINSFETRTFYPR